MLNHENVVIFAMNHYHQPHCKSVYEFHEDYSKTVYIKRLLNRMIAGEEVNHRLILNHLIMFYNVFSHDAATELLFFKIEHDKWGLLKTFLSVVVSLPEYLVENDIILSNVKINEKLKKEIQ